MNEKKKTAPERFEELKRTDLIIYNESRMTRLSDEAKSKIGILRARFGLKSDNSTILTLIALYEDEWGQTI